MTGQDEDLGEALLEAVRDAAAQRTPLVIRGGGSKKLYENGCAGTPLRVAGHRGIIAYQPTELVLTARAGTPLAEIEALLARHGQMLPFEPPHFGPNATLGGTVACGLSGPRRPFAGAVRDAVLGLSLINGLGQRLAVGGQVLKNVAGFDVARLMAGALGTLGVILDVSVKLLPRPECERTLAIALHPPRALAHMQELQRRCWPLTGLAYAEGWLRLRLAGSEAAVAAAARQIGSDRPEHEDFWIDLKEQRLSFFQRDAPLWRLALPPAHRHLDEAGDSVIDWGGGLRWVHADDASGRLFALAGGAGGHACRFRGGPAAAPRLQPLPPALLALHQRIKQAFDPHGIFNRGRLYAEL